MKPEHLDTTIVLSQLFAKEPELSDAKRARQVLVDLRHGQPPVNGILGLTPNGECIEKQLEGILEDQGLSFHPDGAAAAPVNLFVRGQPGRGKTHFLRYLGASQARLGAATAWLRADQCQGRFHYVTEWLPILLDSLEIPQGDRVLGLRAALRGWREERSNDVREWIKSKRRSERHGELAEDLSQYLRYSTGALERLMGRRISKSTAGHQRRALNRLSALSDLLVALGVPRLVLLIDQLETMERLVRDIRSRVRIYGFWHDPFAAQLPSTVALWSVVPDQFTVLERDLRSRLDDYRDRPGIRPFIQRVESDPWPALEPAPPSKDECVAYARRITALYLHAHGLIQYSCMRKRVAIRDEDLRAFVVDCMSKDPTMRCLTTGLIEWLHEALPT